MIQIDVRRTPNGALVQVWRDGEIQTVMHVSSASPEILETRLLVKIEHMLHSQNPYDA